MTSRINLSEALQDRRVRRLAWLALVVAVVAGIAVAAPPTRDDPVSWVGTTGA